MRLSNLEINLFAGAGACLVVAGVIIFHKPIMVWTILALFSIHKAVSF